MSVDSRIADRLIPYANEASLKVLFKYGTELPLTDEQNPSSEQVLERWNKLPVHAASNVARSIKDSNLLDKICEKERRKTVRVAIAANKNTSEPTLLFLFQESLRNYDRDLMGAVIANLSDEVLLEMIINDPSLDNHVNYRRAVKALVHSSDLLVVKQYLERNERSSYIAAMMLDEDSTKAFETLQKIDYDLSNIEWRKMRVRDCGSVDLLKTLLVKSGVNSELEDVLVYSFSENPAVLAEIEPRLLEKLLATRSIQISKDHVSVFTEHGLLSELIKSQNSRSSLDKLVADTIDIDKLDKEAKLTLSLLHPDAEIAASLVGSKEDYLRAFSKSDSKIMQSSWVNKVLPYLTKGKAVAVIEATSEKGVRSNTLSSYAESLKITQLALLEMLPDTLFEKLEDLPDMVTGKQLIELVSERSVKAKSKAYALLLKNQELEYSDFYKVITHLVETNQVNDIVEWLPNANSEQVQLIKELDKNLLLDCFYKIQNSRRYSITWHKEVISLISPEKGWGSMALQSNSAAKAAMEYLSDNIAEPNHWEIILGMFSAWNGTLDQLIHFAKKV